MVHAYLTGSLMAACDGSVKQDDATFGYVFSSRQETFIQSGYERVPNTNHHHTSQRAEGAGAVITILSVLQKRFNIQQKGYITIYMDNEGVVEYQSQASIKKGLKVHLASDTDLNMYICHMQKHLNTEIIWEWVKGHQDEKRRSVNSHLKHGLILRQIT